MKILLALILTLRICLAQDSYFFDFDTEEKKPLMTIEGNTMNMSLAIKRIKPPKAQSIIAYNPGLEKGKEYQIQINLSENAEAGWIPKLNLAGDIIVAGVSISRSDEFVHSFCIKSSNLEQVKKWVKLLADLMKVPQDKVSINL